MAKAKFGAVPNQGPRIYMGPSISGTALTRYTVFKEELPDFAVKLIEQCPEIEKLLVPVTDLDKMQRDINTQGSYQEQMCRVVAAKFAKGGEK